MKWRCRQNNGVGQLGVAGADGRVSVYLVGVPSPGEVSARIACASDIEDGDDLGEFGPQDHP